MTKNKSSTSLAFTLVEIVVTATILVILTSIWFYSYTKHISDARDSSRLTDISALSSQLSLYKRDRWAYPFPWNRFNIVNGSVTIAYQWKMNNNVALTTAATSLPLDPELDIPYLYSTTRNRQEFQLAASAENSDSPYTILQWDYRSVSKNILPNIILALDTINDTDVSILGNKSLFLFNQWFNTLPYDFDNGSPYSDGETLTWMLNNAWNNYWQNTDLRDCSEINLAGKNITATGSTDEYQILDSNWVLENTDCDGILIP